MTPERLQKIKELYIKQYPQLKNIKYGNAEKAFWEAATILVSPKGVTPAEHYELTKLACGVKSIGIKEARKKAGLSQAAMSEILGIPKRNIEGWETGDHAPAEWAERLIVDKLLSMAENKDKAPE